MEKHIWWLNHHAIPPVVSGGTRHFSLAKSLKKLGYKATIINGSFDHINSHFEENGDFGQNLKQPLLRSYEDIDFYSIPTPHYKGNASFGRIKNMLSYYFGCMKYLKANSIISKPDIIIGSVVHPFAAYAAYRLSKYYKVPFVYEVRDLWPKSLVELGRISSKHPFVILLDKLDGFLAKKANLIITTAPLMKNHYIERFDINPDKFLWITNGTDFVNKIPSPMRKIGENEKIEVGYTGTIGLANGIREFLEELTKIPEEISSRFNFTFVGEGPQKEQLAKYAKEQKLQVEFRDAVNKEEVWDVLNKLDMFLITTLPTKLYRFGVSANKLADYHAASRPIIMIMEVSENPVLKSGGGYVAEKIEELTPLLDKILKDSVEEYQRKAKNARIYAESEYNWDVLAEKFVNGVLSLSK